MNEKKAAAYRQGMITIGILFVLTVIEFWIGVNVESRLVLIFIIGLLKAGIIVQNFMHIYRLWNEESH
ncbi:MAG: cytochrome C oxidase subunit IV family protein [Ardenticatenaceae bacterium]|nr:cytochrome C oxidase subunit IV family protein [Ardenticatenaceae bacterium]MCB9444286.1 cytochrome C oxidase subunit IV family protein [Ardenticatenaceae bacterium]